MSIDIESASRGTLGEYPLRPGRVRVHARTEPLRDDWISFDADAYDGIVEVIDAIVADLDERRLDVTAERILARLEAPRGVLRAHERTLWEYADVRGPSVRAQSKR